MNDVIISTNLPLPLLARGKVRDTYELGDRLLMVATDRLSAFDVVFNEGIPKKGAVLTQLSAFWFRKMGHIITHHMIDTDLPIPPGHKLSPFSQMLRNRSMLVKRCKPIKIECIVRGYLSGSGWKSYQKSGKVCGIALRAGLKESSKLDEPIFTPTTKAEQGHDFDITYGQMAGLVGKDIADELRERSIKIYEEASAYASQRGILLADTKFEFGQSDGQIIWIDEALTPDSSRFWPADDYGEGRPQKSFDKQYVRDYLESLGWNKSPPPPPLPPEVIENTTKKYIDAYEKLAGEKWRFD